MEEELIITTYPYWVNRKKLRDEIIAKKKEVKALEQDCETQWLLANQFKLKLRRLV